MKVLLTCSIVMTLIMASTYPSRSQNEISEFSASIDSYTPQVNNGIPSKIKKVVGLAYYDSAKNKTTYCSGLYVSAYYVLTAKHCTCHNYEILVTNEDSIQGSKSGAKVIRERGDQKGAPCANGETVNRSEGSDLALLRLDRVLPSEEGRNTCADYSIIDSIKPWREWLKSEPKTLILTGYGANPSAGLPPGKRQSATVNVSSFYCETKLAKDAGCKSFTELTVDAKGPGIAPGTGSCMSDSGAPAYLNDGGSFVPVGLVSRAQDGPRGDANCGPGGIYTHLGRRDVIDWLRKKIPNQVTSCGYAVR